MSIEARLKQGLPSLAAPLKINEEADLVRVVSLAQQRERRNLWVAAFAVAVAVFLLLVGPRFAEAILDRTLPTQLPADRDSDEGLLVDEEHRLTPEEDRTSEKSDRLGDSRKGGGGSALGDPRKAPIPVSGVGGATKQSSSEPKGSTESEQQQSGDSAEPLDPPSERTESKTYTGAAVPIAGGTSGCEQGAQAACVRFETNPGEDSLDISISDDGGGAVYAAVQIDRDADGDTDGEWTYICNETVRPVEIPSDGVAVVFVEIYRGTCTDGSGRRSNPVSGTVTASFLK